MSALPLEFNAAPARLLPFSSSITTPVAADPSSAAIVAEYAVTAWPLICRDSVVSVVCVTMPFDCALAAGAASTTVKPAASATTIVLRANRRMPISVVTRCQPLSKNPALPENLEKLL
jgi:hypothetical protein